CASTSHAGPSEAPSGEDAASPPASPLLLVEGHPASANVTAQQTTIGLIRMSRILTSRVRIAALVTDPDTGQTTDARVGTSTDVLVGTIIGERYRVIERIGEGGMGAVYRAEHTLMKKLVAV